MKLLPVKAETYPIQESIYDGESPIDSSEEVIINLSINDHQVPFNLTKNLKESNLTTTLWMGKDKKMFENSFDIRIISYPNGNIAFEKLEPIHPETSRVRLALLEEQNKKYLLSYFYFERQPYIFSVAVDKIFEVTN